MLKKARTKSVKMATKLHYFGKVQLFLLVIFIGFVAGLVGVGVSTIGMQDANEASKLTNRLLQTLEEYQTADEGESRQELLSEAQQTAKERRELVSSLAQKNPDALQSVQINPTTKESFPKNVQENIETQGTFRGTLEVAIIDGLDEQQESFRPSFKDRDNRSKKLVASIGNEELIQRSGEEVVIEGIAYDDEIIAYVGTNVSQDPAADEQTNLHTPTTQTVAVVMLNFQNDTRQPKTADAMRSDIFTSKSQSANNFYNKVSNDMTRFVGINRQDGDIFGYYTIGTSSAGCDIYLWENLARQKAAESSVDLSLYDHVIYYFPKVSECQFAGAAILNGNRIWLNGNTGELVVSHELGHNFGLLHANRQDCYNPDGQQVLISETCTYTLYQNHADTMGNMGPNWGIHFTAYHMSRLKYLGPENTQTIVVDGDYSVQALGRDLTGIQTLRIPIADNKFIYIEYRPSVFDSDNFMYVANPGIYAHIAAGYGTASNVNMLDGDYSNYFSPILADGAIAEDTINGIRLRKISSDNNTATIRVSFDGGTGGESFDVTPPTVPTNLTAKVVNGGVQLNWQPSTDDIDDTNVNYAIYVNGRALYKSTTNSYFDDVSKASAGSEFKYSIRAIDTSQNYSDPSNEVTIKITGSIDSGDPGGDDGSGSGPAQPGDPEEPSSPDSPSQDTSPPSQPTNLRAKVIESSQVNLSWHASKDNVGVVGYNIFRNGTKLAISTSTSYGDATVQAGTTASYYVVAFDAQGNTSKSSLSVSVAIAAPNHQPEEDVGVISGRLLQRQKHNQVAPIAGATIELRTTSQYKALVQTSNTDVNGNFSLDNIKPGTYELHYNNGKQDKKLRVKVEASKTTVVSWEVN